MMDRDRVGRTLKRIAYQVMETNRSDRPIILVGLGERGRVMAGELEEILSNLFGGEITTLHLSKNGKKKSNPEPFSDGIFPLIVDDVIFTGKTMFNALKNLSEQVDFDEIHTAVLVDRGHRKFPVMAEFVGMEIPTKLGEHISVKIENAKISKVVLELH